MSVLSAMNVITEYRAPTGVELKLGSLGDETVSFDLEVDVPMRGFGLGTFAIRLLVLHLDFYRCACSIRAEASAEAVEEGSMTQAQLQRWYEKFGFVSDTAEPAMMRREPVT